MTKKLLFLIKTKGKTKAELRKEAERILRKRERLLSKINQDGYVDNFCQNKNHSYETLY